MKSTFQISGAPKIKWKIKTTSRKYTVLPFYFGEPRIFEKSTSYILWSICIFTRSCHSLSFYFGEHYTFTRSCLH